MPNTSSVLAFGVAVNAKNDWFGCLICPRAAERNDYMNYHCYSEQAEPLVASIKNAYRKTFTKEEQLTQFIEAGGWKARKNGRDIDISLNYSEKRNRDNSIHIFVENPKTDWKQWIKTIGVLVNEKSHFLINYRGNFIKFEVNEINNVLVVYVTASVCKDNAEFVKLLKNVFRKAACCVGCKECQADCPYGNLTFTNGSVKNVNIVRSAIKLTKAA